MLGYPNLQQTIPKNNYCNGNQDQARTTNQASKQTNNQTTHHQTTTVLYCTVLVHQCLQPCRRPHGPGPGTSRRGCGPHPDEPAGAEPKSRRVCAHQERRNSPCDGSKPTPALPPRPTTSCIQIYINKTATAKFRGKPQATIQTTIRDQPNSQDPQAIPEDVNRAVQ
jgi:hypothetical protein